METIHGVPIEPLPRPAAVVQRQVEKGEDGLINFLGIDIHTHSSAREGCEKVGRSFGQFELLEDSRNNGDVLDHFGLKSQIQVFQ
jgi:hypothetical protein